jgi:hypothetical protein
LSRADDQVESEPRKTLMASSRLPQASNDATHQTGPAVRWWRTAVAELRQAIEREGDSGARVRSYGMKVVDYFPYLKLGIAYHQLGEESATLEAFDTEERLGVVQGSPEARGIAAVCFFAFVSGALASRLSRGQSGIAGAALRQSLSTQLPVEFATQMCAPSKHS